MNKATAPRKPTNINYLTETLNTLRNTAAKFIRKNTVLIIAVTLAVVTSFIITPDRKYLSYFDFKTLSCLFCTLAVVCALKNIDFFSILSRKIVKTAGTVRMAAVALVYITFIGSMLIANDMALITFLPLGYFVLASTGNERYMAFIFIMQNIAANLGGMLTPFGNPQNLYLYNKFNISDAEFVSVMFPPFIVAIILITVCCLFLKNEKLSLKEDGNERLQPKRTTFYLILFVLSIVIVFDVIPYWIGLIAITVSLFFADKKALKAVDYPLLFTFVSFFIFAGNMSRIDIINRVFSFLLNKSTLIFSVISCQIISNVPSAILLSQFTDNYRELLVGVNIGGTGTLIASLASLITFREYTKNNPGKAAST